MTAGGRISGEVRGDGAPPVELAGVDVLLYRGSVCIRHASTDESGRFDFDRLAPDRYELDFDGSTSPTPGPWAGGDRVSLVVGRGEELSLTTMVPRAAVILGRVTDAGNPSVGVPHVFIGWRDDEEVGGSMIASAGGYYRFVVQPARPYVVSFGTRRDPRWQEQWWPNATRRARAIPVVPREGETMVLNVRLKKVGSTA